MGVIVSRIGEVPVRNGVDIYHLDAGRIEDIFNILSDRYSHYVEFSNPKSSRIKINLYGSDGKAIAWLMDGETCCRREGDLYLHFNNHIEGFGQELEKSLGNLILAKLD